MTSKKIRQRDWFTDMNETDVERNMNQKVSFFDNFHRNDVPIFRPKGSQGNRIEYDLRICPTSWKDPRPGLWGIECFYHPNIGSTNGSYLCFTGMEKMCQLRWQITLQEFADKTGIVLPKNTVCPIEEAKALRQERGDEEGANKLYPRKTVLVWVIDRKNEKLGPMLWKMPYKYVNEVLLFKTSKRMKRINDAFEGYDLTLQVSQQGKDSKNVNYSVELDDHPSPLHENVEIAEKWLDFLEQNPLPKMLVFVDGDYIAKIYHGEIDASEHREEIEGDIDLGSLTFEKIDEMTLQQLKAVALKLEFSQSTVDKLDAKELTDFICKELNIKTNMEEEVEIDQKNEEEEEKEEVENKEPPFDDDADVVVEEEKQEEKQVAKSKAAELREKIKKAREEQKNK